MQLVGAPLPEGTLLGDGRFRLGPVKGRGRQGITYAAVDERWDRPVAVIELFPVAATRRDGVVVGAEDFATARERFGTDAHTLARFGHPNVVRIVAVVDANGTAYAVVEAVEGDTLASVVDTDGSFPEAEALDVAQQAADALAAIRLAGLVSRGLDPSALVRRPDGRVVLTDPGLTALHDGTRPTPADDVLALGRLLYHLLRGAPPPELEERRAGTPLVPLWRANAQVSRATSNVVDEALALEREARPASTAVLLGRLGLAVEVLGSPDLVDLRDDPLAPPPVRAPWAPIEAPPGRPATVARGGDRLSDAARRLLADDLPPWRPPLVPAAATVALVVPVVARSGRTFPVPVPVGPTTTSRLPWLGVHSRTALTPAERLELARTVPEGRRWVTVPLGIGVMALASARPAGLVALLVLAVAPVLATVGDRALGPERAVLWLPVWWARNLVISTMRSIGALILVFLGTCLWFGADAYAALAPVAPWVVRGTGVLAGGLLGLSIGRGGDGFRSHLGLDAVARLLMPRGRLSIAATLLMAVGLGLAALGLTLDPTVWPL